MPMFRLLQEGPEELGEQDLKEEEEGEYILTPQEVRLKETFTV